MSLASSLAIAREPWFSRALPFATYMAFILIQDIVAKLLPEGPLLAHLTAVIYPVKTAAVVAALIWAWRSYDEVARERLTPSDTALSIGVGVLVFVLWINMDWTFAFMGEPTVYDPTTLSPTLFSLFIAVRLFGASVVVPVFEEIFWRSLVLRYIIDPDFTNVPIGRFTWSSFLIASVLFGLEHFLVVAGIVAGLLYNLLLYKTRSIWHCIIAHGVTNLLLGLYVLQTGEWRFW